MHSSTCILNFRYFFCVSLGSNCTSVVLESKFNPTYLPYFCHLDLTNKTQDITIADIFTIMPHFDYEKGEFALQF